MPIPFFKAKLTYRKYVYTGFTPEQVAGGAQVGLDSVKARIQNGMNVYDLPARPLKPGRNGRGGYPEMKLRHGNRAIRDWTYTGHTLRCLKVTQANQIRAVIEFLNESLPKRKQTAAQIAYYNNQRERQFGVSPRDNQAVNNYFQELIRNLQPLQTTRAA
jgi:hypothetical protein